MKKTKNKTSLWLKHTGQGVNRLPLRANSFSPLRKPPPPPPAVLQFGPCGSVLPVWLSAGVNGNSLGLLLASSQRNEQTARALSASVSWCASSSSSAALIRLRGKMSHRDTRGVCAPNARSRFQGVCGHVRSRMRACARPITSDEATL